MALFLATTYHTPHTGDHVQQAGVIEYRYTITIRSTPEEHQTYRAMHALGSEDSTRNRIGRTLQEETEGLGLTEGWWHQAVVN